MPAQKRLSPACTMRELPARAPFSINRMHAMFNIELFVIAFGI
jgi:hypothetical protein